MLIMIFPGYRDVFGNWLVRPTPLSQTRFTRCRALSRGHLIDTLLDAAVSTRALQHGCNIDVRTNAEVVSYKESSDGRSVDVRLADGQVIKAAFLVAADGIHSPVRQQLLGHVPAAKREPRYTGYSYYRAVTDVRPDLVQTPAFESWAPKRFCCSLPFSV